MRVVAYCLLSLLVSVTFGTELIAQQCRCGCGLDYSECRKIMPNCPDLLRWEREQARNRPVPAAPAVMVGAMGGVSGEVWITGVDNVRRKASTGITVEQNAVIETGADGRVQVLLKDETVFTIGPNSDIVIDEYVYSEEGRLDNKLSATILKGFFRYVTGIIAPKNQADVTIKLPVGILGIRGTEWIANVADSGATQVSVLSGEIEITLHGEREPVVVSANERIEVPADGRSFRITDVDGNEVDRAWTEAYRPSRPANRTNNTFTNSLGMKLTFIPQGDFLMGSSENEPGRFEDEGPLHLVRITKPFYLGVYEVTGAEFREVMGYLPNALIDPALPATKVSWSEANEFCRKLSAREGRKYRLPTEAEWEYACRAGTQSPFYFGRSFDGTQANFNSDSSYGSETTIPSRYELTAPGTFPPNEFGLYDMHGNAAEWCSDWFEDEYSPSSPMSDPSGPREGDEKVTRGGAYYEDASFCRSASRQSHDPARRPDGQGFRIVSSALETKPE